MQFADYCAIAIIVSVIGGAIFYIVRAKRRGVKCIGCPNAKSCGGCCSHCPSQLNDEE